ncbi:MAG: isoprenylcysteine carboxyl methyltransferase [Rickettsiales bacterium]|nr:isoprenylcysteine carboxyl methyltransferase [Rickettsiales bacterium]|tara:strand:+ start:3719 stop:4300 length:582 start_codon:yes stop_codon:yes gene_type:complete
MNIGLNAYFFLIACVAAQRLLEVRIAARNTDALLKAGATEFQSSHYTTMKVLHTSWLIACLLEASSKSSPPLVEFSIYAGLLFAAGQILRIAAMTKLGPRWTTRIIVLTDVPPVDGGIYRFIKHPNYLGVILEIAALPLIFGCWMTAVVFTVANLALLLGQRIPAEEAALRSNNSCAQTTEWAHRPRFVPGRS